MPSRAILHGPAQAWAERLHRLRARYYMRSALVGLLYALQGAGLLLLLATLIELLWWSPPLARQAFWVLFAALLAGWLAYGVALPLLRRAGVLEAVSLEEVAGWIVRARPEAGYRLLSLIQLGRRVPEGASGTLWERALEQLDGQLRGFDPEKAAYRPVPPKYTLGALVPWLLYGLLMVGGPESFQQAGYRLWDPFTRFERPQPFRWIVHPGDVELVRGASLEIMARAEGHFWPRRAVLEMRALGIVRPDTVLLRADSTGRFRYTLPDVRAPLAYRISAEGVQSPWFAVTVVERPLVRQLFVRLLFPAYLQLPPRALAPNVGEILAPRGTQVLLEAQVNKPVQRAEVRFASGRVLPLRLEGTRLIGRFAVAEEDVYWIWAQDEKGLSTLDPIQYRITPIADEPPWVGLLEPDPDFRLTEALQVPMRIRIADDVGFSDLRLYYRRSQSAYGPADSLWQVVELPIQKPKPTTQELVWTWDLQPLGLVPGDEVEYYLEVRDNDEVSGPKRARTGLFRARFPTLEERFAAMEAAGQSLEQALEDLLSRARQFGQAYQSFQQELRRKVEPTWEDERRLQQLRQEQQAIEEEAARIAEQVAEMSRDAQENRLLSAETLQRLRQLEQTLREIQDPAFQEALRQLQEAMQRLSLPQIGQWLDRVQINESELRRMLERTLELLRQAQLLGQLDELQRRAEELARTEAELRQRAAELDPRNTEARQQLGLSQEQAAERAENLARELEQLQERLRELRRNRAAEQVERSSQGLEQTPSQMRQNAGELREGDLRRAGEQLEQFQQQFNALAEQMRALSQSLQAQQQQINAAALRRALEETLALSEQQEALRRSFTPNTESMNLLRTRAREQEQIRRSFTRLRDTLSALSRRVPEMNETILQRSREALEHMQRATEALSDLRAMEAIGYQRGAMKGLNDLALLLADALSQVQAGAQAGMMSLSQLTEELRRMAEQQARLNEQIQEMLNRMQSSGRLPVDLQQRLEQMALQQEMIRRQLEQLARQEQRAGARRVLGDLEQIARQMQETIGELLEKQLGPTTVRRQQQILQRLLDAQRSIRERDEEPRRQARTAQTPDRDSPAPLRFEELRSRLERDLMRALEAGYAPDYEALIRRYFELLQKQDGRPGEPAPEGVRPR